MGWIIGTVGNLNAGLMVLVLAGGVGACAMLPLVRRYRDLTRLPPATLFRNRASDRRMTGASHAVQ
jgi:hypothetical protein